MNWSPAARAFVIFVGAVVATGVAVIVLLVTTKDTTTKTAEKAEQNFTQLQDQESLLRIVLAVTGCTVSDTAEQCREKVAARGIEEGERRIAEVDCRIRLALANLPSPAAGKTCVPPTTTTTGG